MRQYLFAISLIAATSAAFASTWSLDSCIAYAIEHNLTVKQRQVGVMSAEQAVADAKSGYLPSLSAGASQSWNLGRGLTANNTYAERNTSSLSWNASLSLPLFNGLRTPRQVEHAKTSLLQVTEQYEAAKDDITINVITAYLQVLYCEELYALAQQQVELSEYELSRRQALLEAGKIPEIDMLEAKSQLAADQLSATQCANDAQLARLDLIQLLQIDEEAADLKVLPVSGRPDLTVNADEAYAKALQHNHAIAAARRGIDAADRNISLARTGYIPSLSFNAGLGSSYYQISGLQNESFASQMRHNYSTYFGLSLQVPIFDAFSTRNSIRRAKIEKLNAQLELDQTEQQLYRSIQQAYCQAVGAKDKMASSAVADEAAQQAFAAMQEKYNLGRATPSEYEQSKAKALRTAAEHIQATYEYMLRTRLLLFYSQGQ